jgi:surfactin synthase thioesterase subunit
MRADFTLFDEYQHGHAAAPQFTFPVTAFWGHRDRRITEQMVQVGCACWGGLWLFECVCVWWTVILQGYHETVGSSSLMLS